MTWRVDPDIPGNIEVVSNTTAVLDEINNNVTVTLEARHWGRVSIDFNGNHK